MSLLTVKNLRVTFDTEAGRVEAVRGVSFDLNRERLGTRQQAHDDGAWVRDAMQAYADRQRAVAAD